MQVFPKDAHDHAVRQFVAAVDDEELIVEDEAEAGSRSPVHPSDLRTSTI